MRRGLILGAVLLFMVAGWSAAVHALSARGAAPQTPLPGAPNCPIFPSTNVWNDDIAALPTMTGSATLVNTIGANTGLHPDFGHVPSNGIPYQVVPTTQPRVSVKFLYPGQSDAGPYPIPPNPPSRPAVTIISSSSIRMAAISTSYGMRS